MALLLSHWLLLLPLIATHACIPRTPFEPEKLVSEISACGLPLHPKHLHPPILNALFAVVATATVRCVSAAFAPLTNVSLLGAPMRTDH